jgi:hypothetical protein
VSVRGAPSFRFSEMPVTKNRSDKKDVRQAAEKSGRSYQAEMQKAGDGKASVRTMPRRAMSGLEVLFGVDEVPPDALPIVTSPNGSTPLVFDGEALHETLLNPNHLPLPWQEAATGSNWASIPPSEEKTNLTHQSMSLRVLRALVQHYEPALTRVSCLDDLPPGQRLTVGNNRIFVVKSSPEPVAYYGRRKARPDAPAAFAFALFRPQDVALYEVAAASLSGVRASCTHPEGKQLLRWKYGPPPTEIQTCEACGASWETEGEPIAEHEIEQQLGFLREINNWAQSFGAANSRHLPGAKVASFTYEPITTFRLPNAIVVNSLGGWAPFPWQTDGTRHLGDRRVFDDLDDLRQALSEALRMMKSAIEAERVRLAELANLFPVDSP